MTDIQVTANMLPMLNIAKIRERMAEMALSQSALAEICQVSRESASNWLSGESVPRPKKLHALSAALALDIETLLYSEDSLPEPVVAYRTRDNREPSKESAAAAKELAEHLRELAPFVRKDSLFSPPVLEKPSALDAYITEAAVQTRQRIGVSDISPISRAQLIGLHITFGSVLVPVFWGTERSGHENALSVYLPETKTSWVVFSLNARNDDFNYWLAHELGHCYTLHELQGEGGETFAERFAQELLFPSAAAESALAEIGNSKDPFARAHYYADAHDISVVTVIRQVDRVARNLHLPASGLETDKFWSSWRANRHNVPTVGHALFGTEKIEIERYVEECERIFGTQIFHAIQEWQRHEGGRSPAFIASALNSNLSDALELSTYLNNRCGH